MRVRIRVKNKGLGLGKCVGYSIVILQFALRESWLIDVFFKCDRTVFDTRHSISKNQR